MFTERDGCQKWPLSDQSRVCPVSLEVDLQESPDWPRAQWLLWESPSGTGHEDPKKNGMQTGESCQAMIGIQFQWNCSLNAKSNRLVYNSIVTRHKIAQCTADRRSGARERCVVMLGGEG